MPGHAEACRAGRAPGLPAAFRAGPHAWRGTATVLALGWAAPASAAASGVTFWSGWFTGQSVTYPNPSTSCTTPPFAARSEPNETSKALLLYTTTDCTGHAIRIPATDIHSFTTDIRSFRAEG